MATDDTIQDVEVLPAAGGQFALDWGYRAGAFLKTNFIAVSIGMVAGMALFYFIQKSSKN